MASVFKASLPQWVLTLLGNYLLPEQIEVYTKIAMGRVNSPITPSDTDSLSGEMFYPGLIPDYSVGVDLEPTADGANYKAILKKSVGFYGVAFQAVEYAPSKFNDWTFPVTRKNFGFMSFQVGERTVDTSSIHFEKQTIIADAITPVLSSLIAAHDRNDLLVEAENSVCTSFCYQMAKQFNARFWFLPVYEQWIVNWYTSNTSPEDPSGLTCPEAYALWESMGSPVLDVNDPLYAKLQACYES